MPSHLYSICHNYMGENFFLQALFALGEEAVSAAIRELHLSTIRHRRHSEETVYDAFLRHTPVHLRAAFRDLYGRLHGGP